MGTPKDDAFTWTPPDTPCMFVRRVGDAGLTEQADHAIEQILEHRRRRGSHNPHGPTVRWLRGVLNDKGVGLDEQIISRHIRQVCSCYREQ